MALAAAVAFDCYLAATTPRGINACSGHTPQKVMDRSQYTSIAFGKRCEEIGVRPSMGTVGDAYDNAMAVRQPYVEGYIAKKDLSEGSELAAQLCRAGQIPPEKMKENAVNTKVWKGAQKLISEPRQ